MEVTGCVETVGAVETVGCVGTVGSEESAGRGMCGDCGARGGHTISGDPV